MKLQKTRNYAGIMLVALLALAVSACTWEVDITIPPSSGHDVRGRVTIGGVGVANAQVFFEGSGQGPASTNSQGYYSARLHSGTYRVAVQTLHGSYSGTPYGQLHVSGDIVKDFTLNLADHSWYKQSFFRYISGLGSRDRQTARWSQKNVLVHMATDVSLPPVWRQRFWNAFVEWESILRLDGKPRLQFHETSSWSNAHIRINVVRGGDSRLAGGIGNITRDAFDGHLQRVAVYIHEDYAHFEGMIKHLTARAMGAYVLPDGYEGLLMYQRYHPVTYPTVFELSSNERKHLQLVYDLPPGIRVRDVAYPLSVGEGETSDALQLEEALLGTTYSGEVLMPDGNMVELTPDQAAALLDGSAW